MRKSIHYAKSSTYSSIFALAVMAASSVTLAQDANEEDSFGLEEIIVTAQKKEQSLQDVPIAVSAFSADALGERIIEDAADLQMSVPNFIYDNSRLQLRGIGNNAISSTAESGIGYHINGVYLLSPALRSTEYFDLERAEVLRGPQGTLYGRNTTGGVLNLITKKATDEFGGYANVQLANYDGIKLKGALNIPLGNNVRQRFAGVYLKRDGYNTNIYSGNDIDGRDQYALRSSTSFDLSENFTADLVLSYLKEDSNRASETKGTCAKDATYGCSPLAIDFGTPDVSSSVWYGFDINSLLPGGDYFSDANNPNDYRTVNVDMEPRFQVEEIFASLELNYDLGDLQITSLTGYHDIESDILQDFDRFASNQRLSQPITYRADFEDEVTTDEILSGRRDLRKSEQFSQEFRVATQYDGAVNFLAGLYYFDLEGSTLVRFSHPTLSSFVETLGRPAEQEFIAFDSPVVTSKSKAAFGEAYLDLSDATRLTVGVRYTEDTKGISTRTVFLSSPEYQNSEDSWQVLTGKVALDHRINEDTLIYAVASRGYKAGGLNPSSQEGDDERFKPEYLNTIEFGSKSSLMNDRLRVNLNAFYYDYEDLQISGLRDVAIVTVNGDATVKGLEAEFLWAASERFVVDFNASYLDVTISDLITSDSGDPDAISPGVVLELDANGNPQRDGGNNILQNVSGNTLRNSPNFSFKIGADYTWDAGSAHELVARVDYIWQDKYFANEFNKPSDEIGAWGQGDASLTYRPIEGNWSAKLFMKNVFDSEDVTRIGQDGPLVGRFRSVHVLEPRTYGLEVNYTF